MDANKREQFGAFRYAYFTTRYEETYRFYEQLLKFTVWNSWDRSDDDKGCEFKAGNGRIEILHQPESQEHVNEGLDYRVSQGVFMGIQTWDIDGLYSQYKAAGVTFKQDVVDQSWGHRSFSVIEPNGLVIYFFQEQF